jgi:hypothetical protein
LLSQHSYQEHEQISASKIHTNIIRPGKIGEHVQEHVDKNCANNNQWEHPCLRYNNHTCIVNTTRHTLLLQWQSSFYKCFS